MIDKEQIIGAIKGTLGYAEAENKTAFMAAAMVGYHITVAIYKPENERLLLHMKAYNEAREDALNDLKTMSNIINKYSDKD